MFDWIKAFLTVIRIAWTYLCHATHFRVLQPSKREFRSLATRVSLTFRSVPRAASKLLRQIG
ncbi:MAG: hypothetical protein OXF84_05900, partial [Bacteroidetes bacterium]|nr:hypothetical protein [Bacteroidota bacterium]